MLRSTITFLDDKFVLFGFKLSNNDENGGGLLTGRVISIEIELFIPTSHQIGEA